MIRLEQATRLYPDGPTGVLALADVSLEVAAGEFVALVGPSGSGKTTLLNLVAGLEVPSSGRVVVAGLDLGSAPEADRDRLRREAVGYLFQAFHLDPDATALENVALPLYFRGVPARERRERAREALSLVGLESLALRRAANLSGGQRQRVSLARALAHRPRILLADEPLGSLDAVTGQEIVDLLARLHQEQGLTLLVATHDEMMVRCAGRVVRLAGGRLVEGEA